MNCSEFMQRLDLFIDGELNAEQRAELEEHARQCERCREQMRAAEQLRDILSQMDENIAVPLPAQACWRSAVRREASRRRMKRIYTAVGAVAAACVLTFGVTGMLRANDGAVPAPEAGMPRKVAYVQTDGLSETAVLEASEVRAVSMDASYAQCRIFAEDLQAARDYLMDVVTEYDGAVEREVGGPAGMEVYLQIPGGNVADFITAVDHIGTAEDTAFEYDALAESVGICVVIVSE